MSFFVSKNGSLKKSESGTSNVSPFDASTSDARSPPFKQIRPFGSLLRDFGEMLRLAKGESASRRITARLTTKSNLRWHSPASPCWNVTFASPMARATSWATLIFLPMRSMRWNLHWGHIIASGMPGNPPPHPKSRISVSSAGVMNLAMARLWRIW